MVPRASLYSIASTSWHTHAAETEKIPDRLLAFGGRCWVILMSVWRVNTGYFRPGFGGSTSAE